MLTVSYLQDWCKEVIAEAKEKKPFAPENGQPLKFKIGDRVTYTNGNGAKFRGYTITGFYTDDDSHYALGMRYMIDWDHPWMGVREINLKLEDD